MTRYIGTQDAGSPLRMTKTLFRLREFRIQPFTWEGPPKKRKCGQETRHWLTIEVSAFIDGGCVLLCYELATGYGEPQGRGREKEMKQTQPKKCIDSGFFGEG